MGNCFAPISPDSSDSEVETPAPPGPSTGRSRSSDRQPRPSTSSRTPSQDRNRRNSQSLRRQLSTSTRQNRNRKHSRSSSLFSMGGPSLDALRNYATLSNPRSSLAPSKLLISNKNTIAIFDSYPKAKYHFLILPRYPFPPQSDPDSKESIIPLNALDDLKSLLLSQNRQERDEVMSALYNTALEVEEMIKDEMLKTEGYEWKVDMGFHAIPSMKHIHLHVISDDRISSSLKTKKHHNSFRPDLGFFVPIMEVQRWLEDDSNIQERVEALADAERLLNTPLTCHKCDEFITNIPKLKIHLEKHFVDERASALRHIARHGRQRSSDEDMF
ncbi:aprataxin [Kwoniella mangroviensis CBS 10435]|uniref:Aprataxin n=1 Tax=Kwoniella mangroviensis CBS 10435 TaxID=1331196 RepID=A0A1B9IJK6_9TREE|nr:aprataxin [Kwoniella mangroviensis CBS 8507]OCF55554.1 aprataxin [Kwoniella mangroviensis CBS 10435]OCF63287.1 aprataxin [Kwoniella mangroviensis CBS 8507]OCF73714.1 aprataxin [Kwoniella mangroviensis CBS 8886]